MSGVGTAFLGGIFALLVGALGFYAHMLLRQEKFKEILYKEKLAVYKEVFKRLTVIHAVLSQKESQGAGLQVESDKLRREASGLAVAVVDGAFVVPAKIFECALEFAEALTVSQEITAAHIEQVEIISPQLVKLIRKDLGVDKLFKFPPEPSPKPFRQAAASDDDKK